MNERTEAELFELAAARAEAIGRPVVVVSFTSTGQMRVLDVEYPDGQPKFIDQGTVPVHPTPREEGDSEAA
jgi:hypothetical protein